ncbi:MAG: hypothetical protein RL497_628 [Pseudomonadota bacterium]|jgi:nicotinamide-nucleotide amidase
MQQAIVGYHQDAEAHWVAQLACGHNQHVRHNPPWSERLWVTHSAGRHAHLGQHLNCVKCDQQMPPDPRPDVLTLAMNTDTDTLAQTLGDALLRKSWHVSCAESCTGGLIAAAITDIPGSSGWFTHGWITYSNLAKQQQLMVPDSALAEGAVSRATVEAMAQGAQRISGAQCAIASSGIAGPSGGSTEKPVGTVWLAWSGPWGVHSQQHLFQGNRQQVRQQALSTALSHLISLL